MVSVKAKYALVVEQLWGFIVVSDLHLIQSSTRKYLFPESIAAIKKLIQQY